LIKLNDLAIDPIGISWAMTNDLIANGGSAVEGMKFIHVYYENGLSHENPDFVAKYTTAFGESPSFISGFYYECTGFLLESMIRSDSLDIDDVKQSLLDLEYKVINDTINLNAYGDRKQEFIMYELKDGSYEPLDH
jgi:branched-chain amino acid transport system substrate-binding protein